MHNLNVQLRKKTKLVLQEFGRTDFMCTQVHGTGNPNFTVCICVCACTHAHACIKLHNYKNIKKLNSNDMYIIDFITMAFCTDK